MFAVLSRKVSAGLTARLTRPVTAVSQERLRLRILFAVAALKLFNFIGGAWDIQWHVAIGRDSLWIPPHLLVMIAFVTGLLLVLVLIGYETWLALVGADLPPAARLGPFRAPAAVFGIAIGYSAALLSAGFDELWHRTFGIDATLWSPPHLLIMVSTMVVDYSLMLGLTVSARRLGHGFDWRSPLFWGLALTGAYAFEAVNFQMGEAFIVGYRQGGAGLYGLLYPLLLGAFLPLYLVTAIRLARRGWIVLVSFALALIFQYLAIGISAAGFAILKPVPMILEYVRQNPQSTAAKAREFAALLGFNGLIGFHQAWTMLLSLPALGLVALLDLIPGIHRRPRLAGPFYAAGMLVFSYLWFQQIPLLRAYPIGGQHLLLALLISLAASLISGGLGWRLAGLIETGDWRSVSGD
jgi:hypothetical protein